MEFWRGTTNGCQRFQGIKRDSASILAFLRCVLDYTRAQSQVLHSVDGKSLIPAGADLKRWRYEGIGPDSRFGGDTSIELSGNVRG
jgi:hypothetical protein